MGIFDVVHGKSSRLRSTLHYDIGAIIDDGSRLVPTRLLLFGCSFRRHGRLYRTGTAPIRNASTQRADYDDAIFALTERLRKQSRKARNHETAADLQLAIRYLRALAAMKIAEEVEAETDPERRAQLQRELIQLYSQYSHLH